MHIYHFCVFNIYNQGSPHPGKYLKVLKFNAFK